ncbi:MAG: SH3 domain-containing protein [Myxococcota bacterium]
MARGLAVFGLVWVLVVPAAALACMNEYFEVTDEAVQGTRRAERLLANGRADRAYRTVLAVQRSFGQGEPGSQRAERLLERVRVLEAIATVRLDGRVDGRRARSDVSADQRESALGSARRLLERRARSGLPVDRAHYAEALALRRSTRDEALRILRELAEEDLMPDAWGFRTLAKLEELSGNDAARDAALEQCRERVSNARRRDDICPGSAPAAPAPTVARTENACEVRVNDPSSPLNVRERPGGRADVVGTIPHDTVLQVGRRRGRWLQVRAPLQGWVWADNTRRSCPDVG